MYNLFYLHRNVYGNEQSREKSFSMSHERIWLLCYFIGKKKIMLFHKNSQIDFKTTKRTDVLFLSNNCTFIIPENRIIKRLSFSTWNKSKLREIEDFQIPKSLSKLAKLYFARLAKKKPES